ncbi:hypothetical protein BIY24_14830 [Halobacteriovorax marinus]|uniref:WbuC family cupin fold metalloprotein n=1 Tax=Halobacteriovorax marinus TaxID=97084 RepID=UPI000BC305C7|nr:WbuC family cupin fold metalloprotein [Halobacteriovorax marinus]ATH09172.1 hypothetical protein BIY24_14830 [Halobacteriovorax marinus]
MSQAIFKRGDFVSLSIEDINTLKEEVTKSPTKRYRYCLHQAHQDTIQEMVIAMMEDSYCRPHSHPQASSESYHIIEGELLVLIFNNKGKVIDSVRLNSRENLILRMNNGTIHMPIALSEIVIYHETISGPFEKDLMVHYVDWAPREDDIEESKLFLNQVKSQYE